MEYKYFITSNNELYHHGVKGMKWGVRRYQNADGSLTAKGKKRYRKMYDSIKLDQKQAEYAVTENKTGISAIDNYNSRYYNANAKNKLKVLTKKIGERGISDLDEDVIREGKAVAEKARRDSELFNKTIRETYDMNVGYNALFLRDPKHDYDYAYDRYVKDNLVNRGGSSKPTANVPNTTGRLVNLDMIDERTGKKSRTVTAHESVYTEDELRKREREANKSGNYRKIYV